LERRLAAIFAADVVGYSGLMEADEGQTLAALKSYRQDLIEPEISEHGGRVVKLMGDGILAEFPSALDAVKCAVGIQTTLAHLNAENEAADDLRFRIGINVGDVVVENGDLYGDGVNVAARLETLAEPGGICVSDDLFRQVRGKTDIEFEDLGEQHLKNIHTPMRVFRVRLDKYSAVGIQGSSDESSSHDRPSIVVLPFKNRSGGPEQEYFADGITEDIITELSRFKELFVITRNSAFHFKGQPPKIREIGKDLGVQYVVEGSVRKLGNRVRISAQLLEAKTESHLWAERYDRDLVDIFALQDEVVEAIASAVPGRIEAVATEMARRKPTHSLTAYDNLLRGEWAWWHDDHKGALQFFEQAIALDPGYSRALARLAILHSYSIFEQRSVKGEAADRAHELIEQALRFDDEDASILAIASSVYSHIGKHDLTLTYSDRALALNQGNAEVVYRCGIAYTYAGDPSEGLKWFERALRLNPYYPDAWLVD